MNTETILVPECHIFLEYQPSDCTSLREIRENCNQAASFGEGSSKVVTKKHHGFAKTLREGLPCLGYGPDFIPLCCYTSINLKRVATLQLYFIISCYTEL